MIHIQIEANERLARGLSQAKIEAALKALDQDGVVVLRQAIAAENVDKLGQRMLEDLANFSQDSEIDNNYQGLRPPPFHPFLFEDIVFNESVIAISQALLGPEATLTSYGANTAFIGSTPQRVHADAVAPEPGPYHACQLMVVNVPLVDMTEENGATIFWPGTHKDTRLHSGNRHPTEAMIEEWEAKRPSERTIVQRGDIVLRDMRVWHGGMPNRSQSHRPMLAMVHRHQKPDQGTFEAEKGSEAFWESHPGLGTSPMYRDKPIDYLHQGHSRPHRK